MKLLPTLKKFTEEKLRRPKILLLCDDMFAHSGIGTMAHEFVLGTVEHINWVQIAGAASHKYHGQRIDMSNDVSLMTGVYDPSVVLYPYGEEQGQYAYGDPDTLRKIINTERPDAILHFTDPRFWDWLYSMEYEIHNKFKIPIIYYSIWDNLPYPYWNKSSYSSCDLLIAINKQTHLIHKKILEHAGKTVWDLRTEKTKAAAEYKPGDILLDYVPHGVNESTYRPITRDDHAYAEYTEYASKFKKLHNSKFVVFWNNRNMGRKSPLAVIQGFATFLNSIDESKRSSCLLFMHTEPNSPHGPNLYKAIEALIPTANVYISETKYTQHELNFLYNIADVTVNVAKAEGFGLSSVESLMAGTVVLNNVTGGLQDHMRFVDDNGDVYFPTENIPSNNNGTYTEHGEWCFPIYPSVHELIGSQPTPYIYEDIANFKDIGNRLTEIFALGKEERDRRGISGRNWVTSSESCMSSKYMSVGMFNAIVFLLNTWKPPTEKFKLYTATTNKQITETGIN